MIIKHTVRNFIQMVSFHTLKNSQGLEYEGQECLTDCRLPPLPSLAAATAGSKHNGQVKDPLPGIGKRYCQTILFI